MPHIAPFRTRRVRTSALRSMSATGDRDTSQAPLRRRLMRAATPVVRISAQSAAYAAVGDGSAPREHAPQQRHSARDVSALPRSAPRRRRPRPLTRVALSRTDPPRAAGRCRSVAIRWAVRSQRPRRSSPRSCLPHTAPLGACLHHLHRRYAGNAESARRLIASRASARSSPGAAGGRLYAHNGVLGSAPCRRQANAGHGEQKKTGAPRPLR